VVAGGAVPVVEVRSPTAVVDPTLVHRGGPHVPTPIVELTVETDPLSSAHASALVVGAFAPASGEASDPVGLAAGAEALAAALGIDLATELAGQVFDGSVGASVRIPTRGAASSDVVVVVGLGKRARAGTTQLRRAAAAATIAADRLPSLAIGLVGSLDRDAAGTDAAVEAQAVAEGALLGAYRFTRHKSTPPPFLLERVAVHVEVADEDHARDAIDAARITAGAVMLARDLVNTAPQAKRPPELAETAATAVSGLPIEVRVLDEQQLAEGGYGGILGVGQGSSVPPRLVELRYRPADAPRHVALVGKGITFDTGGISLKPSASMETMKSDMAGAAVALATVRAAAELGLPIAVTALLALAENMPSGSATRVSDVLTMRNGTTVEVINTDAEGRLVLGDALAHASELEPDVIVDLATLTGAAVVALGDRIGVVMANEQALADTLVAAGRRAGEPLWALPLAVDEYGERIESTVADLRNAGNRAAGTIFGGLFLHRFVGDGIAWAHLDIAGVAWTDEPYGEHPKGATGVPVRTLVEWLRAGAPAEAAD
jgi:leucyl aminopeptidase